MKIIKSLVWKIILSRIGASIILSILGRFYIKQPLWLHVGGHRTGTTTLQKDIFPHHPQIKSPRIPATIYSKNIFPWFLHRVLCQHLRIAAKRLVPRETSLLPALQKNPSIKSTPTIVKKAKICLFSHEPLSSYIFDRNIKFEPATVIFRKKIKILYVIRNETTHLQSLWLAWLSGVVFHGGFDFPFCTADEFAKMTTPDAPPMPTEFGHSLRMAYAARTNAYCPKPFIEEILPRWGGEIHILPYELFMEEPKTYLDKISNLMDIDSKITWNLYKNARADEALQNFGHTTMPNFLGNRNLSMRQRGLEFCRNFKHERRLYDADWKLFFRTADKYAATLPQQPRKAFTDTLMKIKNNWSGNSTLEIYKLATEPTFTNWLRCGEKVKPEFSKKTLAHLREIRAPQNRWLAKKFDLDLERYGYAM